MAQTAGKSLISRLGWFKGAIKGDKEDDTIFRVHTCSPPASNTGIQPHRSLGHELTPWRSLTQVKTKNKKHKK